jgi:hypothetical protein
VRTAAEIRGVYPALSESEAELLAAILDDYPNWAVWPMVGYPSNHVWYARRNNADMPNPIRRGGLAEIPIAIDGWIAAQAGSVRYSGQATR